MKISIIIPAMLSFCLTACDDPPTSPVSGSAPSGEAELRATRERIERFERQMGRPKTAEPKPVAASTENGPTDQQILEVAKQLAEQTIGMTSNRMSAGPIGVTAGYGERIGPLVRAVRVHDINRSVQGAECLVIVKVECDWLPALQQAGQVSGGFQPWFERYGSLGVAIKDAWLAEQRTRPGINFVGVKLLFRRFDTGWQFQTLIAY